MSLATADPTQGQLPAVTSQEGTRRLAQEAAPYPPPGGPLSLRELVLSFNEKITSEPGLLCVYLPDACKALRNETAGFDAVQNCTEGNCPCDPTGGPCPRPPSQGGGVQAWMIAVPVVLGVVLLAVVVGLGVFFCCRRKRKPDSQHKQVLATHHSHSKNVGMVQQPSSSSRAAGGGHVVNVGKVQDDAIGVAYNAAPRRNAPPVIMAAAATTKLMSASMEHAAPGEGGWCTASAVLLAASCTAPLVWMLYCRSLPPFNI